mgnify:FL=1
MLRTEHNWSSFKHLVTKRKQLYVKTQFRNAVRELSIHWISSHTMWCFIERWVNNYWRRASYSNLVVIFTQKHIRSVIEFTNLADFIVKLCLNSSHIMYHGTLVYMHFVNMSVYAPKKPNTVRVDQTI